MGENLGALDSIKITERTLVWFVRFVPPQMAPEASGIYCLIVALAAAARTTENLIGQAYHPIGLEILL